MNMASGFFGLRTARVSTPGRITGVLLVQSGANGALVHAQVQSEQST